MKTTIAWAGLMVWSAAVMAQEQDDMYFNKKDRAKQQKARATQEVLVRADAPVRFDYPINKNNSGVASGAAYETNPEFIARSQSEMVSMEEDQAHFIENYQYNTQNELNQFSNNLNQWNNNPLYSNAYFAPSINNWNSPFYSPFNDPFLTGFNNNPWCNPLFRSGWSVSFNFGWGNPWNYWGPSAFWGWNDPFWNNGWNNYAWGGSMWNSWGWNSWNNPNTIIIIDNDGHRGPVYGKRGSRGNGVASNINSSSSRSRSSAVRTSAPATSSSRQVASRGNTSQEYYTPQWRRSQSSGNVGQGSPSRTYTPGAGSRTSGDSFSRPSSGSSQRSSSFSSPSRSSGSFSSPSRSGGSSGGGGTRSSSSRGRGN
jgi:hypothetical protein